jgi:hypothetical protein
MIAPILVAILLFVFFCKIGGFGLGILYLVLIGGLMWFWQLWFELFRRPYDWPIAPYVGNGYLAQETRRRTPSPNVVSTYRAPEMVPSRAIKVAPSADVDYV